MDKFGQGVQFEYSMLQKNKELNFEGFNRQMLLEMCILSGCDYLQSLPGMGLKKAHASIKRFKSYDKVRMTNKVEKHDYSRPRKVYIFIHIHTQTSFRYFLNEIRCNADVTYNVQVLKHLRYSGVSVPPFYEESFRKAILTFQYQRVYDPVSDNIVHLSNIPDDIGDELDFLGPYPLKILY